MVLVLQLGRLDLLKLLRQGRHDERDRPVGSLRRSNKRNGKEEGRKSVDAEEIFWLFKHQFF